VLTLDRAAVAAALPYTALVDALDAAFAADFSTPVRAHHSVPVPGEEDATLLLMPAWQAGKALGVKIASVFPGNARRGLASVNASYVLLDAATGIPVAIMDGAELTLRRTAAASALASRYLSRPDAASLLMIGTGKLAPHLVAAHRSVRSLQKVTIWGRRQEATDAVLAELAAMDIAAESAPSLQDAVAAADIVSCATLSQQALVRGEWLRAGQHLDLVGAFTPQMREADDAALARARVYVDTFAGACVEAGEIVQGMAAGVISRDSLCGELAGLARGTASGRQSGTEITLFKSVGSAIEDLAAAQLAHAYHAKR
jgi:ornithine cyclodeaminase/alanine dehydrogenase-like protein (mu-crystallin family)